MGCLSKCLVSGTEPGKAAGVGGEEAGHAPGPVVDLELRPVGLVGAGLGAVVPVVCSWQGIVSFGWSFALNLVLTAGNLPDWAGNIFIRKYLIFSF